MDEINQTKPNQNKLLHPVLIIKLAAGSQLYTNTNIQIHISQTDSHFNNKAKETSYVDILDFAGSS